MLLVSISISLISLKKIKIPPLVWNTSTSLNPLGYHVSIYPDLNIPYANFDSNVQRIAKGKAKYEIGLLRSIVALSLHIDIDTMSNDKACMVCNPQVF